MSTITIREPFMITSRLLTGVRIGEATVSLGYAKRAGDEGRTRYEWFIDLDDGREFSGYDLQSGCQGGNIRQGFASLLSFLGAFAESVDYQRRNPGREGENSDLFPAELAEWAMANSDNFDMLRMELEPEEYCECGDSGECESCQHIVPIQED